QRENEIRNVKTKTYYCMDATTGPLILTWQDEKGGCHSFDGEKIESIIRKTGNEHMQVTDVMKKTKRTYSPSLYDLTELQRDANKQFGLSAKETLNVMQNLYERHKVVTYARKDSRYLSSDIVTTIPERLKDCGIGEYRSKATKIGRAHVLNP